MPMNPNFLCCIGAELKNSTQQTTRMSQVYLYRAFEDETLSDMLSAGFFNAAMGIIRQDDLLLLYSPNETTAKYTYARVSSVSSSGVVIEQINIDATQISVDTTGFSNITGNNLQEVLQSIDSEFDKYVKKDGSSVMTGPLKFRAGSFVGAIAGGLGDGISIYKLKSDDSIDSEVASLTKENGFTPGTTNAQDIGSNSLKWKDLYIARVIAGVLNNGADISVPTVGGTMALVEDINNKITNCITEIPQDIKLELNNGTLTLKAGSKVYVPNGSGTFDSVTTTADVSTTRTDSSKCMVWRYSNGNLGVFPISLFYSGATAPTQYTFMFWYDTTNNLCKVTSDGGSTWISGVSFPLCIVSTDGTKISAIDQVFNGFGYVGSTAFALPGVKGLIPNGRNADGTLKNIQITINNVLTTTDTSGATGGLEYYLSSTSINRANFETYFYNAESNNIVDNSGIRQNIILIDPSAYRNSGKVSSFNPKKVFHALDYNDSDYIANCAMPSDKYIDLTLPASGGSVIAPADGYITIAKATGAVNEYVSLTTNSNIQQNACCPITGFNIRLAIPVSKGDVVSIGYTASGTTNAFRFVYANGAK